MRRLAAIISGAFLLLAMAAGGALADERPFQDALIGMGGSGGMVSDNGQIDLAVAPNTYNGVMNIRYTPNTVTNVPAAPAGTIWVSSPFNLSVYDVDQGKLVSTDNPMTLNVHYNPSDLGGRYESTLQIVRLYDQWAPFPSTVDTSRHVVTTQITFGGDYGLIASNVPPAPAPAPAPAAAPAPAPAPAPAAQPATAPTLPPPPAPSSSSAITGRVFFDKNGDGVMNGDDFPVGGAGVIITAGSWYSFVRTGGDGTFSFTGLAGANYTVNVVVGPEWAYTTPVSVSQTLTGQPGANGTANFGIWPRG